MKTFFIRYLLSYAALIFSASIGYYTIYGLSKSTIEYFCIQKREGSIVYSESKQFSRISINRESYHSNPEFEGTFFNKVNIYPDYVDLLNNYNHPVRIKTDDLCSDLAIITKNLSEFIWSCPKDHDFSVKYKINEEYFDLKCKSYHLGFTNQLVEEANLSKNKRNLRTIKYNSTEDYPKSFSEYDFDCDFEKRLETCDIEEMTQNAFYRFYILMFILSTSFLIVPFVDDKNKILLRCILSFISVLKLEKMSLNPFCNPINGMPVKIKRGQKYTLLCQHPDNNVKLPSVVRLKRFEDKEGYYEIKDNGVFIVTKTYRDFVNLSQNQLEELESYFGIATIDLSMCACDGKSHFYTTKEVIDKVTNGETFRIIVNQNEDKIMLDVNDSDFKFLKENFSFLANDDLCLLLLEHNKLFFKLGRVLFEPLFNCLKGNHHHFYRPKYINNSSWKWYGSDFKNLMKSKSYQRYKSQVDWRESYALISARCSDIKVIKTNREVEVNIKHNDVINRELNLITKKDLDELNDAICSRAKLNSFNLNEKMKKFLVINYNIKEDEMTAKEVINTTGVPFVKGEYEVDDIIKASSLSTLKKSCGILLNRIEGFNRNCNEVLKPYVEVLRKNVITKVEIVKTPRPKEEKKILKYLNRHNNEKLLQEHPDPVERNEYCNFDIKKTVTKSSKSLTNVVWNQFLEKIKETEIVTRNYYDCLENYKEDETYSNEHKLFKLDFEKIEDIFKKKGKYKMSKSLKIKIKKDSKRHKKNRIYRNNGNYKKFFVKIAGMTHDVMENISVKEDGKSKNTADDTQLNNIKYYDLKKSIAKCSIMIKNKCIKYMTILDKNSIRKKLLDTYDLNTHMDEYSKNWGEKYPTLHEMMSILEGLW